LGEKRKPIAPRRVEKTSSPQKQKNRGQKNQNRRVLIFLPQMFLH
jgi:hypothetical protein